MFTAAKLQIVTYSVVGRLQPLYMKSEHLFPNLSQDGIFTRLLIKFL